ncbi:MAG: HEAT repeat domain-containing protein [Chloroflexi bacterium]|nr:HEAT repeat domain-containing protein [Chloroflexota bacterium]
MSPEVEVLLRSILDPSRQPARAELQGLSDLTPRQLIGFDSVWLQAAPERRRWVTQTLVDLAEDNVELIFDAVFKRLLADTDVEVRRSAIEGLWENRDRTLADRLLELLRSDPDESIRAASASSLGRFASLIEMRQLDEATSGRVRSGLLDVARNSSDSLEVRRRAVESLGFISGDAEILGLLAAAYADPVVRMRASALFAMGRNCDERWLDILLSALNSEENELRFEAARACGELEDERAVPYLVPLLTEDEDLEVKLAVVEALGHIGGDRAERALRRAARDPNDQISAAANDSLEDAASGADSLDFAGRPRGLRPSPN